METLIKKQAECIEELEQELRIVRRQLEQFQSRQMDEIAERRRAAMQFYREEYERQQIRQYACIKDDNDVPMEFDDDGVGFDEIENCIQ